MRKLRYSIYIHIVRLPSVGQVFGSLCLGGSIVTPLVSVLVCLFSPFRYAFGPNLVRFAHPAYSGRMLKQRNIGILGSGKPGQSFVGKTLFTTKLVNVKLVCKIIPATTGSSTFQYSSTPWPRPGMQSMSTKSLLTKYRNDHNVFQQFRARAGHYFYPVKLIFYFTGAMYEAIRNSLKKLL